MFVRTLAFAALPLALTALLASSPSAQVTQNETQTVTAALDADAGDRFGAAVAISGVRAIVGAPRDDGAASDAGAAYVLRYDGPVLGWVIEDTLHASDAGAGDEFGTGVAISGDVVVVGAPRDDDIAAQAGAAYVFRRSGSTWNEEAKLVAPPGTGAMFDFAGRSVAVATDRILVGVEGDDGNGLGAGAAFAYRFDGSAWNATQVLRASATTAGDAFGHRVSIGGKLAAIASFADDIGPDTDAGSVTLFRDIAGVWDQDATLIANDREPEDLFGSDIAVSPSGALVVVGADHVDGIGTESGAAYVFRFGTNWQQEAKLVPSDSKFADNFGFSVDVCGDTVVVGSIGHDDAGNGSGSAYAYRFNGFTWAETAKLAATDAAAGDELGSDVAVRGEHGLVGARLRGPTDVGALYAFDALATSSWSDLGAPLAGALGDPVFTGTGVLCGDDPLSVTLSNALPNTSTALVIGLANLSAPFKGGTLVPTPDLVLTGLPTGPSGTFATVSTLPANLPPGFTFYLQHWISDPAGPKNFAASNALAGTTE